MATPRPIMGSQGSAGLVNCPCWVGHFDWQLQNPKARIRKLGQVGHHMSRDG